MPRLLLPVSVRASSQSAAHAFSVNYWRAGFEAGRKWVGRYAPERGIAIYSDCKTGARTCGKRSQ